MPVLVLFAVFGGAAVSWNLLLFPVAMVLQAALLVGLGLIVAPLCVMFGDLERTTRLVLRALFYASPIIYGVQNLPGAFSDIAAFNPLSGIFTLYRIGFFPDQWDALSVIVGAAMSLGILGLGLLVFPRLERPVLKEL